MVNNEGKEYRDIPGKEYHHGSYQWDYVYITCKSCGVTHRDEIPSHYYTKDEYVEDKCIFCNGKNE